MYDSYKRSIYYLRISVTDRCNFRCAYCMPPEGVARLDHTEVLSYEELLRLIGLFAKLGISKIRLTGGEPLVRLGIIDFISRITALGVIEDLSLTTNGSLLGGGMARSLKAAGLHRVNISLDTVNPSAFYKLTGQNKLRETLRGIQNALKAGLKPVKINVVLTEYITKTDLTYFISLVHDYPVAVRFIEYMPIGNCRVGRGPGISEIQKMLNIAGYGELEAMNGAVPGNGPARYYRLPRAQGMIGFITPITEHFCHGCNRIRLTADGKLKPCLLSTGEVDIKTPLRSGASNRELIDLFVKAVQEKPARHSLCQVSGHLNFGGQMSRIGG